METGAKKLATVTTALVAAADAKHPPPPQQEQSLFKAKHAPEFGADVHAVVVRPGGGGDAVRHEFLGAAGREARLKEMVGRAVAKDVSAMGMEEVDAHEKHLQRLRAVVAHELRAKAKADKDDKAAAAGVTSSPAKQEMAGDGGGSSKVRRIE